MPKVGLTEAPWLDCGLKAFSESLPPEYFQSDVWLVRGDLGERGTTATMTRENFVLSARAILGEALDAADGGVNDFGHALECGGQHLRAEGPDRQGDGALAPQGWRGLIWICVVRHSAGPTSSPRKLRQFRRSQPPRDGEV